MPVPDMLHIPYNLPCRRIDRNLRLRLKSRKLFLNIVKKAREPAPIPRHIAHGLKHDLADRRCNGRVYVTWMCCHADALLLISALKSCCHKYTRRIKTASTRCCYPTTDRYTSSINASISSCRLLSHLAQINAGTTSIALLPTVVRTRSVPNLAGLPAR